MIVRRRTKRNLVKSSTNALLLVTLGLITSCSGKAATLRELSEDAREMEQAFDSAKGKVRLLLLISPG